MQKQKKVEIVETPVGSTEMLVKKYPGVTLPKLKETQAVIFAVSLKRKDETSLDQYFLSGKVLSARLQYGEKKSDTTKTTTPTWFYNVSYEDVDDQRNIKSLVFTVPESDVFPV